MYTPPRGNGFSGGGMFGMPRQYMQQRQMQPQGYSQGGMFAAPAYSQSSSFGFDPGMSPAVQPPQSPMPQQFPQSFGGMRKPGAAAMGGLQSMGGQRQTMPFQMSRENYGGEMSAPYSVREPQQPMPTMAPQNAPPSNPMDFINRVASQQAATYANDPAPGLKNNLAQQNSDSVASFDLSKVYKPPPGPGTPPPGPPGGPPSGPPGPPVPPWQPPPPNPPGPTPPGWPPTGAPPTPGMPPRQQFRNPPGPMPSSSQPGQAGWVYNNERSQWQPQWSPEARQFLVSAMYDSGKPASWMNPGTMDAEFSDPNFLRMVEAASGRKFGG